MGRRNIGYIKKREALKETRISNQEFARSKTLDGVVIALGQLGMSAEFLHKFMEEYLKVEADINGYFEFDYLTSLGENKNAKGFKELQFAYSKKKIDDNILEYINEEDYMPFDYRYGIKRINNE